MLGAGGTIAPAIVRDLAESDEVAELLLLDLDEARAEQVAARYGGGKARAAFADARAPAGDPGSLARALEGCDVLVNSASYRVNLDAMRACLEARLPLPRPRRALLDDRPPARARPAVRGRRPARPARHRLGARARPT